MGEKCSFCGGDLFPNEIVSSESNPDCQLCFHCVETLHYFYMKHVFPLKCDQGSNESSN